MTYADWVAISLLVSLTLYVLMGGADFGAGAWDWLCRGPRAARQRRLIQDALAPVWEANHVWLILALVILFTGFPTVFSYLAIVLHVPLTLLLFGIVFRGSAFVLHQYGSKSDNGRWRGIFGFSSLLTPLFLGVLIGTISGGGLPDADKMQVSDYFTPWLRVFPFAIGIIMLFLFMFIAAVYLTLEAKEKDLQDDFRSKALVIGIPLSILLAAGVHDPIPLAMRVSTSLIAAGALISLFYRRYLLARFLTFAMVAGVMFGWGISQYPYLIAPLFRIHENSAPPATLQLLLIALGAGAMLLAPALYYLMKLFKS